MQTRLIELLQFINEARTGKTSKSLVITGAEGSGKTTLAMEIAKTAIRLGEKYTIIHGNNMPSIFAFSHNNGVVVIDKVNVINAEIKALLLNPPYTVIVATNTLPISYYEDDRVLIWRV